MTDSDEPASSPDGVPAVTAARVLVQALAALGVRDVVLAPGSRSAPLAYALADAALPRGRRPAGAPAVRLHVRVDERSAAFLALGLARAAVAAGEPRAVAVVTTSGTAAANLHPAVLEAHHARLPLLLLTADRPHELRGTGANQTTDQVGLFGTAVRLALDVPAPTGRPGEDRDLRHLASRAVAAALGLRTDEPGPVHLDLAYREPLAPGEDDGWPRPSEAGLVRVLARAAPAAALPPAVAPGPVEAVAVPGRRARRSTPTVLIAGDGAGQAARALAEATGWPLVAEPSSGAWGGGLAVPAGRLLLGLPGLGGRVRRAVVLGRPTLSRPVSALLARSDVDVVVVAPHGRDWPDAGRTASDVLTSADQLAAAVLAARQPVGWGHTWRAAGAAAAEAVDAVIDADAASGTLSGPLLARAVAAVSGPGDVLVVGASNPVRDLDLVARWEQPPLVVANRGLAGIDGTTSTAAGVALGLPGRPTRALLGDLTFLHDVGGLLVGPGEPRPDLLLVVAHDGGGSMFATLEHGDPRYTAVAERVFATPQQADLAGLCAGYGAHYERVAEPAGLAGALAAPVRGLGVLDVLVDRAGRRSLDARLVEAGQAAATRAVVRADVQ